MKPIVLTTRTAILLGITAAMCPLRAAAETGAAPALIPRPAQVTEREGSWTLGPSTRIAANGGATSEARKLAEALSVPLGWQVPVVADAARKGDIEILLGGAGASGAAEGYHLTVAPDRVTLRATTAAGLFYGGVTLRQLLPPQIFSTSKVASVSAAVSEPFPGKVRRSAAAPVAWTAPCVEIMDAPRFGWRGLLLDPARHFLPPEYIKRFLDLMALHKFNTLQLHLTDDQGWRLAIRKYPRLTEIGSVRKESPAHGHRDRGDGIPYGPFFYTQEAIRELVAYAQARHITLMPEIEIPGHFRAALAAHPEFSCTGGPFEVRTRWGVEPDILCPGNDAAVAFAKDILAEVCELFPSRFIHIGGDEAPRDRWKQCPKCQARMKAEGLKTEAQLQTWLNHQLEAFLAGKGRRLVGWDEILEGGLTPGATVMSWRGISGGIAAAKAGHDVVMSPTTHCYLDYAQAKGPGEPENIGGLISLETVYAFEPIPAELAAAQHRHILGAQGNLWGEYLWNGGDVEYSGFPRAVALAEVVWSPAAPRDFGAFRERLRAHATRLDALNVNYRKASVPAR